MKKIIVLLLTIIVYIRTKHINKEIHSIGKKPVEPVKNLLNTEGTLDVKKADKKEWQFLASMVFGGKKNNKFVWVSGALVQPNVVLTVAEQVQKNELSRLSWSYGKKAVRLGSNDTWCMERIYINRSLDDGIVMAIPFKENVIEISKVVHHPNYSSISGILGQFNINGIAVIKLKQYDPTNPTIALSNVSSSSLMLNSICRTAGWRKNTSVVEKLELKEASLPILHSNVCMAELAEQIANEPLTEEQKQLFIQTKFCSIFRQIDNIHEIYPGQPILCNSKLQGIAMKLFTLKKNNISYTLAMFEDIYYHPAWIKAQSNCDWCIIHKLSESESKASRRYAFYLFSITVVSILLFKLT